MVNAPREILSEAIARNCGVVLSLPSAGLLRHHKSRLLTEDPEGFWLESVPAEAPLIGELMASGKPAGISFRTGTNKIVFAVPIRRRQSAFVLNEGTTVDALLVAFPEHIKLIQRRNSYRVRVLRDGGLSIRIWRMPERVGLTYRPLAAAELHAEVRDISVGGLGVSFQCVDGQAPKISCEDRLRIELTYGDIMLLMEGQMRTAGDAHPGNGEALRTGILFKSLDRDLEGRQKISQLNRIVGELQRDEIRRCRMGLTG